VENFVKATPYNKRKSLYENDLLRSKIVMLNKNPILAKLLPVIFPVYWSGGRMSSVSRIMNIHNDIGKRRLFAQQEHGGNL
jgi:hypothetical protein